MKVLRSFFCIQSKVKYKKGDDYNGDRLKELQDKGLVEKEKKVKSEDKNGAPKKRTTKKK